MNMLRSIFVGTAAGAVGTAVLNIVTYADMAARGRGSSETPSKLVYSLAQSAGIGPLTADDEAAGNRRSGVGALLGYVNGLGVGAAYGAVRPALRGVPAVLAGIAAGAVAMALSDVPAVRAGVTDPAQWGAEGWVADVVPHVLYGVSLALAFDALDQTSAGS